MQDGLFAQVVLNHLGHEVVDALIVRRAVARGVDYGNVARTVCAHQVWNTDKAVGHEAERIQVLVRRAAVHCAHALVLVGIAVEQLQVLNEQLTRFRQHRTSLFGQIRVLEIGGVVAARS